MFMPPDPTDIQKIKDFVNTSICSFNIHSHDKFITGRCHKPPTGLYRCSLTKPSGLVNETKPVQLIDLTPAVSKPSEKVTIKYEVRETDFQSHKEAISSILPQHQVSPLFRENDPRLIVYEPERPPIKPLPALTAKSTKTSVIKEIMAAMGFGEEGLPDDIEETDDSTESGTSETETHNGSTENETKTAVEIRFKRHKSPTEYVRNKSSDNRDSDNGILYSKGNGVDNISLQCKMNKDMMWDFSSLTDFLPRQMCIVLDPLGDGNCMYRALNICESKPDTIDSCRTLRNEIAAFMLNNPDFYLIPDCYNRTIKEMVYTDHGRESPFEDYCFIILSATPGHCEYGTVIEALVHSELRKINLVIYDSLNRADGPYKMIVKKISNEIDNHAICILHIGNHYQSLFPKRRSKTSVYVSMNDKEAFHCDFSGDKNKTNEEIVSANQSIASDVDVPSPSILHNTHSSIDVDSTDNDFMSFMNEEEIKLIFQHLNGMSEQDVMSLYNTVCQKLVKRNGYVVDYNPILTATLGCHTNSLLLGSSEQAKVAAHYLGPYIDKNKTKLGDCLDVVFEAMEHAKVQESLADDRGTPERFAQHVLTRILNRLGSLMEISDTQAAAALLGLCVLLSSEIFIACDTESYINLIKNEKADLEAEYLTGSEKEESSTDSSIDADDYSEYSNTVDYWICYGTTKMRQKITIICWFVKSHQR
jgi:hypothetical protein